MICPVDRDLNRRRSRRYSCPDAGAGDAAPGPFALSYPAVLQHANRRVERRSLAARGVAVPAAVGQLLLKEPVDQNIAGLAEIRTNRKHPSVDTGLDLAWKTARPRTPRPRCSARAPGRRPFALDRSPGPRRIPQQLERVRGRDQGGAPTPRRPNGHPASQVRPASPPTLAATRDRSRATGASGSAISARMTCHRIDGFESRSHSMMLTHTASSRGQSTPTRRRVPR